MRAKEHLLTTEQCAQRYSRLLRANNPVVLITIISEMKQPKASNEGGERVRILERNSWANVGPT